MQARSTRGVTVLELLITVTVASIIAGIAVPWWSRIIALNHRIAATNQIVGLIARARSEAIKAGREVVLCPNNESGDCLDTDGGWPHGYTMFVNDPAGRPWRATDSSAHLARGDWPARITVLGNRDGWVFRPLARRSTNGTFRICDQRGLVPPRAIIVSATGRPRTADRLASGAPIPCPADSQ